MNMQKYLQVVVRNDFSKVGQLHLIKLNIVTEFKSSTHFVDEEWPFEFGFIVGYRHVQVYTRAYSKVSLND